jgi:hypothetical protein
MGGEVLASATGSVDVEAARMPPPVADERGQPDARSCAAATGHDENAYKDTEASERSGTHSRSIGYAPGGINIAWARVLE